MGRQPRPARVRFRAGAAVIRRRGARFSISSRHSRNVCGAGVGIVMLYPIDSLPRITGPDECN